MLLTNNSYPLTQSVHELIASQNDEYGKQYLGNLINLVYQFE